MAEPKLTREYVVTEQQIADMEKRFTYHPPQESQPARYEELRAAGKNLAILILRRTLVSREQSTALTKLEEALFWANAAIARNE